MLRVTRRRRLPGDEKGGEATRDREGTAARGAKLAYHEAIALK